jgi:uncharacterized protein (DUF58 family)
VSPWLLAPVTAGVAAAAVGVAAAWQRVALAGLGYRCRVEPDRVFPGEAALLVAEVTNAKAVPVPWLLTRDVVPDDLRVAGGRLEPHHVPGHRELVQVWSLGPRQRVRRRWQVVAERRGLHLVGPSSLQAGDPFGWREGTRAIPASPAARLIVYPRLFPLADWGIAAERPFGERARPGWLLPDPAQVVGARPYRAGDPYRQVHWPATARTGALQVKQTVPARALAAALFLDVRTAVHAWEGIDRPRAEAAIALAASLARQVLQARGELALFANTPLRERASAVRLPVAAGTAQLLRVLAALALGGVQPWLRLEEMLAEARALPPGMRLVVVTPLVTPAVTAALASLCRSGRTVDLFLVGDGPAVPALPGLHPYRVSEERVRAWFG